MFCRSMGKKILLFLISFVTWGLLNWPPDGKHLFVGLLAAGFVTYVIGDLFVRSPGFIMNPPRLLQLLFRYIPLFLAALIKGGVAAACQILHPAWPVRSGIIKVKTSIKTDAGLTFLANAITVSPGTMTVDIDQKNGILYVHWTDVKAGDVETATRSIVEQWEPSIKKVFEE